MLCPDLEPSKGSLPLLSPPFGMWKLFPLVLSVVLAGILVLEPLVLGTLFALVVAFEGMALVSPGLGCWEGTAPFGTCGVTLGLMCDPLAAPEGAIGLGMFEDFADSARPEGFSLSFLFVLAMLSVRDQCTKVL